MTFGILAQGMGRGLRPLALKQLLESRQAYNSLLVYVCTSLRVPAAVVLKAHRNYGARIGL